MVVVVTLPAGVAERARHARFRRRLPREAQRCEGMRHQGNVATRHVDAAVDAGAETRGLQREISREVHVFRQRPATLDLQSPPPRRGQIRIGAEGHHQRAEIDFVPEIDGVERGAQPRAVFAVFDPHLALACGLRLEQFAAGGISVLVDGGEPETRAQLAEHRKSFCEDVVHSDFAAVHRA